MLKLHSLPANNPALFHGEVECKVSQCTANLCKRIRQLPKMNISCQLKCHVQSLAHKGTFLQGIANFEPVNVVHRVDEMGNGAAGIRPLLTRRLHGERFGQKPGMKHPTGQYARAPLDPARFPGAEWKSHLTPQGEGGKGALGKGRQKFGPAGVSLDQRRKSPIVEISVLLANTLSTPPSPPPPPPFLFWALPFLDFLAHLTL